MNKQGPNGTGWCDYTFDPVAGCRHGCRWRMPDGQIADCYAKTTAHGLARTMYPSGFAHHYWRPDLLGEPELLERPARIFVGSMADVFGDWVYDSQIKTILKVCRDASWHTFQFLTKNAKRLKMFDFPPNCWVGISSPPTFMWGHELSPDQQQRWFQAALAALGACNARVRWVSFEPLALDLARPVAFGIESFGWAVIGAASRGRTYYQPAPAHLTGLLNALAVTGIPVYMKASLKGNPAAMPWQQEFPGGGAP